MTTMHGKVVVVTGGTSGIGRETALGLARLGAEVIVIARDPKKGAAVVAEITALGAKAHALVADLSSVTEARRVAGEVHLLTGRLDVLVNNAGGAYTAKSATDEGLERTWALNHLAYMALTLELVPLLRATADANGGARVVNVASDMHRRGRIDDAALRVKGPDSDERFGVITAYSRTKLANVMFSHALARRLAGSGVTVNSLHPGVVRSGMGRDMHGVLGFMWNAVVRRFALSEAEGAATSIFLASAPELATTTGSYYHQKRLKASSRASLDEALQERLWHASLAQIARVSPAPLAAAA